MRPAQALVGGPMALLTEIDWSWLLDRVPDQRATNSCVGWAMSSALFLAGQAQHRPIPRPSAKGIYDLARLTDAKPDVLVDFGCRPRAAIEGVQAFGICAETHWPFDEPGINNAPPLDVFRSSIDSLVTGWSRIAVDADAPGYMRTALSQCHFPIFGLAVDEAFEQYGGGDYRPVEGSAPRGNHMLCVVGHRPGAFRVVNSWSALWGEDGLCWIAEDVFASDAVGDILVIEHAPAELA